MKVEPPSVMIDTLVLWIRNVAKSCVSRIDDRLIITSEIIGIRTELIRVRTELIRTGYSNTWSEEGNKELNKSNEIFHQSKSVLSF